MQETAFLILFPLDETGTVGPLSLTHISCALWDAYPTEVTFTLRLLPSLTLNEWSECVKTDPLGPGPPSLPSLIIGALARSLTLHASVSPLKQQYKRPC